jgi:hypothetical protein
MVMISGPLNTSDGPTQDCRLAQFFDTRPRPKGSLTIHNTHPGILCPDEVNRKYQ